ncbi:MAG: hypothetical protein H6707_20730 [Deltaproteobacteria bacterium]|nr:hypothetical protein [Deltaproteobacteria bacterium]
MKLFIPLIVLATAALAHAETSGQKNGQPRTFGAYYTARQVRLGRIFARAQQTATRLAQTYWGKGLAATAYAAGLKGQLEIDGEASSAYRTVLRDSGGNQLSVLVIDGVLEGIAVSRGPRWQSFDFNGNELRKVSEAITTAKGEFTRDLEQERSTHFGTRIAEERTLKLERDGINLSFQTKFGPITATTTRRSIIASDAEGNSYSVSVADAEGTRSTNERLKTRGGTDRLKAELNRLLKIAFRRTSADKLALEPLFLP